MKKMVVIEDISVEDLLLRLDRIDESVEDLLLCLYRIEASINASGNTPAPLFRKKATQFCEDIITRKEAAVMLQVSHVCLQNMVQEGKLKGYKMRNHVYFSLSDVEGVLKQRL